jgi:hypothetical protein
LTVQPAPHLGGPRYPGHLLNVVDPATGQKLNDNQLKAEIGVVFGAVRLDWQLKHC